MSMKTIRAGLFLPQHVLRIEDSGSSIDSLCAANMNSVYWKLSQDKPDHPSAT